MPNDSVIPVRVALRCRPFVHKELLEGCRSCLEFVKNEPQVLIGADKGFTYDFVFDPDSLQKDVYEKTVHPLVINIFKGYNATVLAYGQTGSGKTFTMGTANALGTLHNDDLLGIIPRAVKELFAEIDRKKDCEFFVKVSFLEIYNEDVIDLLNPTRNKSRDDVVVRDDGSGEIKITGLSEIPVNSLDETLSCLEKGTLGRTTGCTAMNTQSSRSHAIFTIYMEQRNSDSGQCTKSKFHLVDLAGSEKAKKTQAQGERFKEGVNINMGLLALGNVISALCEETPPLHVPYRNSKLTRLLQDSLGGNSHTTMIACVSPADSNLEETISTLRYADRARKIKNKPTVNRDPQAAEMTRLKQLVQQLQMQLINGNISISTETLTGSNENYQIVMERNKVLEDENKKLLHELQTALDQTTAMSERALLADMAREKMKQKLEELLLKTELTVEAMNHSVDCTSNASQVNLVVELQSKVKELQEEHRKSDVHMNSAYIENGNNLEHNDSLSDNERMDTERTLRQAKMNRQLQDLNRALALKEELVGRMSANDDQMTCLKLRYEETVKTLESEVNVLQKEKEELTETLRSQNVKTASNKVSEQRRKRLAELEAQMADLKRKIIENNRLAKMKEQSDEKVKRLNSEIQEMKSTRVKLMRQLREESEKFRQWRQLKEKEVAQLKQQDRKRQFELLKMERLHNKQQNVLKRKMEEANTINRRLKDAMSLQKATADRRVQEQENFSVKGAGQRLLTWLSGELEVVVSTKIAEHHRGVLLADRKALSEQLAEINAKLKNQDGLLLESEEIDELEKKKILLQNEIEKMNIQIADFQQKILDANLEDKMKLQWDSIQTMQEAKCVLKFLFETACTTKVELWLKLSKISDLESNDLENTYTVDALQDVVESMKLAHEKAMQALERETEEKVMFMLREMQKSGAQGGEKSRDDSLARKLEFQDRELQRMCVLYDQLQEKITECATLKQELQNRAAVKPITVANKRLSKMKKARISMDAFEKELPSSPSDMSDDEENDPDWQMTPLMQRIKKSKKAAHMKRKKPVKFSLSNSGGGTDASTESIPACPS